MIAPHTPGDPARPPRDPYVELVDDATAAAGRQARAAARSRRDRASDVATWVGTLRDLAERGAPVAVGSSSGTTHRGMLVGLGADHLVIRHAAGGSVVVALSAVRFVRPDPAGPWAPAMGDREAPDEHTVAEVLEARLDHRDEVVLVVAGPPDRLRGLVVALGEDVVTLRAGDEPQRVAYVPLGAVVEVVLPTDAAGGPGG